MPYAVTQYYMHVMYTQANCQIRFDWIEWQGNIHVVILCGVDAKMMSYPNLENYVT